ncbi:MAG: hypothetical protein Q9222_004784 [Ikaeria aurantiellina]
MFFFFIWPLAGVFSFLYHLNPSQALYDTPHGLGKASTILDDLQPLTSKSIPKVALSTQKRVAKFFAEDHGASSSVSTKRSLANDLSALALRFIFLQADVIVSSALAYYQTTDFYRNMTALLNQGSYMSPTVQTLVVTYGALKLTASYAQRQALGRTLLGQILARFAEYMLDTFILVVVAAYRVCVQVKQDIEVWIGMEVDSIGS